MAVPGNGQAPRLINTKDGKHQKCIPAIPVLSWLMILMIGDFFDSKHKVVLGGSWATLPRIAGRRTFRNWYQAGYGYVWAGARVVKDVMS
jgi:formylglycine-generating enzyme required for sulfatase activity